jgi:hypothetical protein
VRDERQRGGDAQQWRVPARIATTPRISSCIRRGDLIKEGHAVALSDGKLRSCFLLNDHLLVCKTKGKKIKVKQLIVLTARSTVNQPSKTATGEGAFELEVNGVRFRLQSAEGRTAWFSAIQSSIDEQETLEKIRA